MYVLKAKRTQKVQEAFNLQCMRYMSETAIRFKNVNQTYSYTIYHVGVQYCTVIK